MIQLEIQVIPRRNKYIEFTQSLNSMRENLLKLCPGISIIEKDSIFTFIAPINSRDDLTKVLCSSELSILSGAIKTLGDKSEVIIHGIGYKKKGTDLREIRLKYSKKKKINLN